MHQHFVSAFLPCRHTRQPDGGRLVEEGRAGAVGSGRASTALASAGIFPVAPQCSMPVCCKLACSSCPVWNFSVSQLSSCWPCSCTVCSPAGGGEGADPALHGPEQRRHRLLLHPGSTEELRTHGCDRHAGGLGVWVGGWAEPRCRQTEQNKLVVLVSQPGPQCGTICASAGHQPLLPPAHHLCRTSCGWTTPRA